MTKRQTDDSALLELVIANGESIAVTVIDSNEGVVDLSGVTAMYFTVKSDPESETNAEAVLSKNILSLQDSTDLSNGIVTVTLTESDTSSISPGSYFWDLYIERPTVSPKNFPSPPGELIFRKPVRS